MTNKQPRMKKTGKGAAKGRKPSHPMRITTPWGRGASEYRPGLFTKQYFEKHGEACCADIYHSLGEEIRQLNQERIESGEKPLKRPNYSSFAKYFHWFKLLGLVERIDRREPAMYDFLEQRQFYRLTDKGKAEEEAWRDPLRAAHPEAR